MSDTEQTKQTKQTTEQIARRRLLKMASYVPPVLLGVALLNKPAIAAAPATKCPTQLGTFVSAPAGSCCPCVPIATKYNPQACCKNYCDPAACDVYVQASGYGARQCKNVTSWCGTTPAGCNCCLDKKGRFICRNPGQACP